MTKAARSLARESHTGARRREERETGRSLGKLLHLQRLLLLLLGIQHYSELLHQVGHHVPAVRGEAGDVLQVGEQQAQRLGSPLGVYQERGGYLPKCLLLQPGVGTGEVEGAGAGAVTSDRADKSH